MCGRVANLFPLWTFAGVAFALWQPAALSWFRGPCVVYSLGATMLAMGLTLKVSDFREVAERPGKVALGAVLQYTIMPLLGFALSRAFRLHPQVAAGLVVVACCPGGTASNVVTFIAGADVALSVAMTLTSTVSAAVVTPFLTQALAGTLVPIDAWALLKDIVAVVLLPTALGLLLNTTAPKIIASISTVAPPLATLVIALITSSVIANNAAGALSAGPALMAALLLLHGGGFLLGYLLSRVLGQDERTCRTNSIEVGMQNSTLGAVLSTVHIGPLAAVPCAISACVHSLMGSFLASAWRAQDESRERERASLSAGPA